MPALGSHRIGMLRRNDLTVEVRNGVMSGHSTDALARPQLFSYAEI